MFHPFLNSERQLRSGWWIFIYIIIFSGLNLPVQFFLHDRGIVLNELQKFGYVAALLFLVALPCQWLRKKGIRDLGFHINIRWLKELGIGVAIGAALMLLPAMIVYISGGVQWQFNPAGASALWSGLALFVVVALSEELLFRGFIFQRLIAGIGVWPAQIIMAVLFLAIHWNNEGMEGTVRVWASINIFLASFMFGQAYIRTRSLAMPIGIHFMANWVQSSVLGFSVSGDDAPGMLQPVFSDSPDWLTGGTFGLEASLPGLVFVIVTLVMLYLWKQPKAEYVAAKEY